MTNDDERAFLVALEKLALLYGKPVPAERLAGYFDQLRDFPWTAVRRAFDTISRTEKYFPSVAAIREAIVASGEVSGTPKGSYPPDVAAQRLRNCLDVTLPVRPDKNAKFGQRWGVQPRPGMNYHDVAAAAREKVDEQTVEQIAARKRVLAEQAAELRAREAATDAPADTPAAASGSAGDARGCETMGRQGSAAPEDGEGR